MEVMMKPVYVDVSEVCADWGVCRSKGYLTGGQERSGSGRFGKNVIEVHQVPVPPQLENPITVNSFTEKSKTVSSITEVPHTENPTQVINNKVNNKKANNYQSIYQEKDGETEVIPMTSRQLVPIQELMQTFEYSELCQILSYHHLLQECRECQLSQYEIKARAIAELKYLISYETLVFDGYGAMVDALLDYMSEIIATGRTITFNNGETYDARSMGNQFYHLDSGAILSSNVGYERLFRACHLLIEILHRRLSISAVPSLHNLCVMCGG